MILLSFRNEIRKKESEIHTAAGQYRPQIASSFKSQRGSIFPSQGKKCLRY